MKNLIVIFCLISSYQTSASELTINILDQEKAGVLFLTICNTAAGFEDSVENESEEASCASGAAKAQLEETFKITIELPDGEYAIAAFLDLNKNEKMDKNFIGIPKEQYGFSNNAMGRMSAPSFEQAKFKVSGPTTHDIKLRSGVPKGN